MGLNDTILAIALSVMITAGTTFTFSAYIKNSKKFYDMEKRMTGILKFDEELRNDISRIKLSYYLSSRKEAEKEAFFLKEKYGKKENTEIVSVDFLEDSSGITRGFDVTWKKDGTEHKTTELFSTVPVLK